MNSYRGAHALALKMTKTTKSLKICYIFNGNHIYFKIVRCRKEMVHQQWVSHFGLHVIERAVVESCQSPVLGFVLGEDILSTCCYKNDVM